MEKRPYILLIDDDDDDVLIFKLALSEIDSAINCITATNAIDGFEQLQNFAHLPSHIFLDLNMPVINGFECLEQLKRDRRLNQIPVIIYTTSNHPRDYRHAIELGAFNFLTKTANLETLKQTLREILFTARRQ